MNHEDTILGHCEYEAAGKPCNRNAYELIKGYVLCIHHKQYGATMKEKKGKDETKPPVDDPAQSGQIVKENAATEFAGAQKEPAFNKKHYYDRTCEMCDEIELNMNRFKKGEALAAAYQKARLILLSEMQGEPKDDKQGEIPLE